jgi:5S rRNA maturation endonuclease (ribonuclease M5)
MTMMKTSRLNDQAKLKILCDDLCDNIDQLFEYFNLDYKDHGKMISMACPIHEGDNISALNLYVQGDNYRGNWKCRTHQCEKVFKGSIIGFVRGLLSNRKYRWAKNGDDTCSFKETIEFITSFLKKDLKDIKVSRVARNKNQFTTTINHINNVSSISTAGCLRRGDIRPLLKIPAAYYIQRGFSAEILNKYDVGLCSNPSKEMHNRIVVPIYDMNYEYMIGCSGRSIFEKCTACSSFHDPSTECPPDHKKYLYSKWKHSTNFKSQNCLYNFWFAKDHIRESGIAIIVESPGNVWKLEENGIHNSVAVFGANLSDRQKILLDASGAMNLIVLMDNDEAGQKATLSIIDKCKNTYRIHVPTIPKADVGEMNSVEIDDHIKQFIKRIL